jgi:hypothetical protein
MGVLAIIIQSVRLKKEKMFSSTVQCNLSGTIRMKEEIIEAKKVEIENLTEHLGGLKEENQSLLNEIWNHYDLIDWQKRATWYIFIFWYHKQYEEDQEWFRSIQTVGERSMGGFLSRSKKFVDRIQEVEQEKRVQNPYHREWEEARNPFDKRVEWSFYKYITGVEYRHKEY